MSENNKKFIIPRKNPEPVSIHTDVNTTLDDALSVITTEIIKFKSKVNKGLSLNLQEARVLQGYIKSLVDLSKESRERNDSMDLASMSDTEITKLVEAMLKKGKENE